MNTPPSSPTQDPDNRITHSTIQHTLPSDDDDDEDDMDMDADMDMDSLSLDTRPTDVSYHRPTNTQELLALQHDPEGISVLFGDNGIVTIDDLIVPDDRILSAGTGPGTGPGTNESKQSIPMTKLVHLEKVLNLLAELISTETDYVRDIGLLCTFLDECTYCSKTAVYSFVNSTAFIGECGRKKLLS